MNTISCSAKMGQAFRLGNIIAGICSKMALTASVIMLLAGVAGAQTLVDLGASAPTPGINDIAQLSTAGNQVLPDGLNYFTDNQISYGTGEPGQTFKTGSNSAGYVLASVAIRTGGLGSNTVSGISTPQPYYLHIYSVSGSTATLLATYTSSNFTFNDGDWLKWSGLSVDMAANTTYAYSFGKASSTAGWEAMSVATNNPYAGGEIGLISPTNSAITFGSSHGFDAAFDLGLSTNSPRNRILLDAGWTFELGDPADVTTNVTYYPEIHDLAKLQTDEQGGVANTLSESYMETIRVNIFATHAGENVSFVQTNYNDSAWQHINLPHDWVVALPFNSGGDEGHGYKAGIIGSTTTNTIAWYRHTFTLPANDAGKAMWLEFDGAYRNCLVWLNGHILGRHVSGYTGFSFDVSQYANPGGTNVLVVRVDASRFEGWFYEGAGIYRHVWLTTENPVHVAEWGTYVATTSLTGSNATITVQTDITNESGTATANASLTSKILDANSNVVATATSAVSVPAGHDLVVTQTFTLTANLWSLQTPYLYNLATTVSNQNAVADTYNTSFGVRTITWDPNNGLSLNGQRVELQGMCNHQDYAGVGIAQPDPSLRCPRRAAQGNGLQHLHAPHMARRIQNCWLNATGWECWCWMRIAALGPMRSHCSR